MLRVMAKAPPKLSVEQEAPAPAPTPAPAAFPRTSDELKARVTELRGEHMAATREILQLEGAGVTVPEIVTDDKAAAVALLSGQDPETTVPAVSQPQARLAALHRRRNALTLALKIADDRSHMISAQEFSARYDEHRAEWRAACRDVFLALFVVEGGERRHHLAAGIRRSGQAGRR